MKIEEIQPNLAAVLGDTAALGERTDAILIDDGLQNSRMEDLLKDVGLAILIMTPQGLGLDDSTRGAAKLEYSCALFVRTNPKVKQPAAARSLGDDGHGKMVVEFYGLTVGAAYTLVVDDVTILVRPDDDSYAVTCVDKASMTKDSAPAWNPLALEGQILSAVLGWSKQRPDFGFRVTKDALPETDWMDTGNNSRIIRFSTGIVFH